MAAPDGQMGEEGWGRRVRITLELRQLALLRRIARALERANELAEERSRPYVKPAARKAEFSQASVELWNEADEARKRGV